MVLLYFIKIIICILDSYFFLFNGKISCLFGCFVNVVVWIFVVFRFEEVLDSIYFKYIFMVRNNVKGIFVLIMRIRIVSLVINSF